MEKGTMHHVDKVNTGHVFCARISPKKKYKIGVSP